ncbi:ABC transporter substrate-binding protein/permease [Demetria terragena]|uniref:ABC transporter substrate-binding protein/permease n=1 Tax=Demetria terragena TaxID=63959 RepID=UPI00037DBBF1|nr:ABC transporter substrate-binding protein/permease [Demetria terragena]
MKTITSRIAAVWLAIMLVAATVVGGAPAVAAAPQSPPAALPATLKVGTEGVYSPFSYKENGELTGFDVDVMRAIGRELGVKIQFVVVPWDSMFDALRAGRIDVIANQVSYNAERAGLYDLSKPYVESTGVVVVAEDNDDIKGLKDIRGKRAAENITSNWADVARKNGAKIVGVNSADIALKALKQGRVDTVVNDKLAISYAIKNLGSNAGVKIVQETDDKSRAVLAARKGTGYMPQLNRAIATFEKNGTTKNLYDKYFSAEAKPQSDWDLVASNAWPMAVAAIKVTLSLTAIAFGLGLVVGLGIALARMSSNRAVSGPARLYISLMRGIPVLVLLFLVFFGPSQFGVNLPSYLAAVIALTLNVSAYCAETIRAAIQSIPGGQWEAGRTVGMDYRTTLRRVIIPQAARSAVPPLSNTLIELLKSTSLVSVILLTDLLLVAQQAAAPSGRFFTMYLFAALYYWLMVVLLTAIQNRVEARVSRFVS